MTHNKKKNWSIKKNSELKQKLESDKKYNTVTVNALHTIKKP